MRNTGAFQAIVRKEMRENVLWAALGMVLMYVLLISGLPSSNPQSSPDLMRVFSITVVYAAVVGLGIGRAQLISENRGDPWGFLVHRPVSRSTLFWGKVVAGVLLYLVAVGVPIFSVAAWLAIPGRVAAPFDWRMTLPAVVDMFCGLIFYFAGLLTVMRDARWYATRAMGIGLGVICGLAILNNVQTFPAAIAFCAVGILITATAAWGTFIAGGRYSTQPLVSRAAAGIAIASGLVCIGAIVFTLILVFMFSNYQLSPLAVRMSYRVASDGTIVRVIEDNGGTVQAVKDIQDNPIDKYKDAAARKNVEAGVLTAAASIDPQGRRAIGPPFATGYRSSYDIYTELQPKDTAIHWYIIHKLGLIAGYDGISKRLIGWIGPSGFTAGEAMPGNRFSGTPQSYYFGESIVAFPDSVYRVNLEDRSVAKIFTAPAGESILGAGSSSTSSESANRFDVIATTKKVYVQSSEGTPKMSIPHDPQAAGYAAVEVIQASQAPGAPMFAWYVPEGASGYSLSEARGKPLQVTEVHSDGSIGEHFTLQRQGVGSQSDVTLVSLAMPPILGPLMVMAADRNIFPRNVNQSHTTAWLLPTLVGLAFAGLIFFRGRAYAFTPGQLLTWMLLGFALGPLGLALMFSLIEWPAREYCPSCGRKRVVTRERCEHCNASFAAPAADGTEIFKTAVM